MTIAQAFKHKKKLLHNIGNLQTRINKNNSFLKDTKPDYDVKVLLEELEVNTKELILLKTAIIKASLPMYPKIYKLSELKSQVSMLKILDKTQGKTIIGYGTREREVENIAVIDQVQADSMIVSLEEEIMIIQDQLDKYNYTTEIESYT